MRGLTLRAVLNDLQPVRFYRPDYHVRTPEMRSPEYVQMSTAAAITLGLVPGKMHRTACTHCLNLLVTYPEGCRANCAYCGLARHREEARDYACGCDGYDGPCQYHRSEASKVVDRALKAWNRLALP